MLRRLVVLLVLGSIISAAQARTVVEPAGLRDWVRAHLRKEYRDSPNREALRYDYVAVDLNGDGRREVLIYVEGGMEDCGTGGCGVQVLRASSTGWRVVADTSIGWSPIRILQARSRGWRDLGIIVAGGGVTKPYETRLRFNGNAYPNNPSVPPAQPVTAGTPGIIAIKSATEPLF
jgi:hypothetical protein